VGNRNARGRIDSVVGRNHSTPGYGAAPGRAIAPQLFGALVGVVVTQRETYRQKDTVQSWL
jgi:hypothetical protein